MKPRVGIVGCGRLGQKRAKALGGAPLAACADVQIDRARALAGATPAFCTADWRELVRRDDVDVVIVATINSMLAEIAAAALERGKHVLIEKPCARNTAELDRVIAAQRKSGALARAGFNHRYHPAITEARDRVRRGDLGALMFLRARYGHGGRLGYDREWRADPKLSGGGELIDQGVHLIDLARLFLGDFTGVDGLARTLYWDMHVDDNAFLLLRNASDRIAFLHVSCTEWKNLFSLEIYGRDGKLHAEGLGGSYGPERLTYYRMLPEMGPPETSVMEFAGADASLELEFAEFLEDIRLGRPPAASLEDARAVLAIVEAVYAQSGYDFR